MRLYSKFGEPSIRRCLLLNFFLLPLCHFQQLVKSNWWALNIVRWKKETARKSTDTLKNSEPHIQLIDFSKLPYAASLVKRDNKTGEQVNLSTVRVQVYKRLPCSQRVTSLCVLFVIPVRVVRWEGRVRFLGEHVLACFCVAKYRWRSFHAYHWDGSFKPNTALEQGNSAVR